MRTLLLALLVVQLASVPGWAQSRTLNVPEVGLVGYGISVPKTYAAGVPAPLVLALHPGGERVPNRGIAFMSQIALPALRELEPIVIAPDCPTRSWADPAADKAVMALIDKVRQEYAVDPARMLVMGFSMGGRGTWYIASRHPDVFTGAIPVAASAGDEPLDRLARIPTYIVHSRDDQVVPFEPAEERARALEGLGRRVRFEALSGPTHYAMGFYIEPIRRGVRWIVEQWKAK